ncbi:alpha/beta hydrolase [Scatolibacter rhodanostii]|uniref:alpha/beta hydrolase n=1 Tax=Scatolibacter rhodanostii TaxID=2014781 RepID=UPI000C07EBB1|nr:alpha/beta hydrolase-fold protein [Scatolibacter rhodanostii]
MIIILAHLGILVLLSVVLWQSRKNYNQKRTANLVLMFCLSAGIAGIFTGCSHEENLLPSKTESVSKINPVSAENSQSDVAQPDTKDVLLEIGETEQKGDWSQTFVYPSNIDDTFVIDICLPDTYDKNTTYPIVYLTDCYWRREDYAAIKSLYQSNETKEFILVGIGYPDDYNFDLIRERDLINEPHRFLEMIINGVIPYVEGTYKIDEQDRTFCGASYGGFFMLYSLFQSDELTKDVFKNYILASPTLLIRTGGLSIPDYEEAYWQKTDTLKANVYLTVGEYEGNAEFQTPIQNFLTTVQNRNYKDLHLTDKIYEGKDHYSVWVPSLLDGLNMYLAKES